MSFADFDDIYRICTDSFEDGHLIDSIKLGIDMTPGPNGTAIPLTSSNRWWEQAAREIHHEHRENVLV